MTTSASTMPVPANARFFGLDSTKVTLAEYLYEAPNPIVYLVLLPTAAIVKFCRIKVPSSTDDIPVESLDPFLINPDELPHDIWAALEPRVTELAGLGFSVVDYHAVRDPANLTDTYLVSMLGPRNVVARVHLRIWHRRHPPKRNLFVEFFSRLRNDTCVWSLSTRADMLAPPACVVRRKPGAGAAALLLEHEQTLVAQGQAVVNVTTPDQAAALLNWHQDLVRDFHVGRGVFRDLLPDEQRRVDAARSAPPAAIATLASTAVAPVSPVLLTPTGGAALPAAASDPSAAPPVLPYASANALRYPVILEEIQKLQNAKAGWLRTLILLGVSIAAFVLAGKAGWAAGDLIYLVPILFFHELGHYLAMRTFGYRNLRMFFIPFFGAAVSGRNYNVAGWKKALVALAGPVPGVLLGAVLGTIGMINGNHTLSHVAILLLALNGYNLLPVLPLDGGHVFQYVLCSRHYVLDMVFRCVALGGLLLLAIAFGGRVLIYVALALGAGIPLAYRLGRAAFELRKEGLASASNSQEVPPEVAEKIIDKLSAGSPKPVATKILAQRVLIVFENLNARPPGVLASIALLFTQGSAVLIAVAGLLLFIIADQGGMKNFFQQAIHQPAHGLPANEPAPVAGAAYQFSADANTVVATFKNHSAAASHAAAIALTLAPNAALRQVGDTVFITFPAASKADADALYKTLSPQAAEIFMQTSQQGTFIHLMALAQNADDAAAIQTELSEYFAATSVASRAVPPWLAGAAITQADYTRARVARATLLRMRKDLITIYHDPAYQALTDQIADASRRGDKAQVATLRTTQRELHEQLTRTHTDAFRKLPTTEVDQDFIAAIFASPAAATQPNIYQAMPAAAAEHLGLFPPINPAEQLAQGARDGYCYHEGIFVHVDAHFDAGQIGIPALESWLLAQHCQGLRYDISAADADDEDIAPE